MIDHKELRYSYNINSNRGAYCYYHNGVLFSGAGICNGTKFFVKNGLLHKEDGPAVIRADGRQEYYFDGEKININIIISKKLKLQF